MKIISRALEAIRKLFRLIPWNNEDPTDEGQVDKISKKMDGIIESLTEDNLKLKEYIRLRDEDYQKYPNIDFGVSVAKYLLLRGLHLQLKDHWHIKSWEHEFGTFSKYSEDARGGKGFFEIKIKAMINRSSYSPPMTRSSYSPPESPMTHNVYAHLHIACATSEHFWVPNHSGSYICIDGWHYFEVQCNWRTGNIEIGIVGQGSPIPEWFKKEAGIVSPEVLVQQG